MTSPSSRRGRRLLALGLALAAPALVGLVAAPAGAATSAKPVWVATSSGSGGRAAAGRVVVRDPSNGAVYVAGSAGVSAKAGEIMVVKYDAAGASQWTATYRRAGAGAQTAVAGALDKAGDCVVLCAVRGARTGVDWAVLEYAPNGTMSWATVIAGRGHGNDVPSRLALAPTGAIYAAGALVAEHGELDAAVVKLTAAGKVSWKRSVAGPGNGADRFSALGLDGAGRVFCAGATASSGARGADCLLAAFSPAGRRLWLATWRGPAHLRDGVGDLAVTAAGQAYVVGWLGTRGGSIAMIRQYDVRGRFVWQATYTAQGAGRYGFVAAALLPHGGVAATGDLVDTRTGDSDIVTIGFAAHGPSLWQQIWNTHHARGRVSKDEARDLTVDPAGRVFVGGSVSRGSAATTDYAVLAYTSVGLPLWKAPRTWNGGGLSVAWALTTAPGGVIVTGQSRAHSGHVRMATVELPY